MNSPALSTSPKPYRGALSPSHPLTITCHHPHKVQQRYQAHGDTDAGATAGHLYFIRVLQYCQSQLKTSERREGSERKTTKSASENQFESLPADDLNEEEAEDDDLTFTRALTLPESRHLTLPNHVNLPNHDLNPDPLLTLGWRGRPSTRRH